MKKIIIFLFLAFVTVSCYTDEDQRLLQEQCRQLSSQKAYLEQRIETLQSEVHDLSITKNVLQSGREIRYIVKFKIKQGTFTLDIFEHAKNEMNAIEIEIPVNKEFYNKLSIGQDITDKFKWGSLVMDGDFSTLHMKVIGKRIE